MRPTARATYCIASLFSLVVVGAIAGCTTKEKVVDIETPGGQVEVERDTATGDVDVKVDRD